MQVVECPLFELDESPTPPAEPLPAAAHAANFPTFLGKVYPTSHSDYGYLVPVDPALATGCDSCE